MSISMHCLPDRATKSVESQVEVGVSQVYIGVLLIQVDLGPTFLIPLLWV